MKFRPASLNELLAHGHDTLIDVRSPSEFAEDHVPGAISLPVLSDEERARVGTIYVQQDPFLARKLGAAIVARNAARHLEGPLSDKGGGWRPLVYCWRGGQRSGSFASILAQIGWRVSVLDGGYRTWRRMVVDRLYHAEWPGRLVVLDGNTGTAKTEILRRIAGMGGQVIDLEGLANHRGSLFGNVGPQPSQKAFETSIAVRCVGIDPARPLILEAESSKIGERIVPPSLWKAMQSAPRVGISAPLEARVDFTLRTYTEHAQDPELLEATLRSLRRIVGGETVAHWQQLAREGALRPLVRELLERHYDPRYAKSRHAPVETLHASRLDDASIDVLAQQILDRAGDTRPDAA